MNKIFIQPLYGLSNRMRSIVGAATLADTLGYQLIVLWVRDESLNAKFSDLFEDIPFHVIECKENSIKYKLIWHIAKYIYKCHFIYDDWITNIARGKDPTSWLNQLQKKNLLMVTCHDIMMSANYDIYKVKNQLVNTLARDIHIDENTIGIHIRRKDNENSIKYSPTYLFVNRINEELKVSPQTKFYLATDDMEEESLFINEFGEHIIKYKKRSLDRNSPIAIQDALIDLYNLSRCRLVLGSYYSSFSDVAALWGCVKKEVLMKK